MKWWEACDASPLSRAFAVRNGKCFTMRNDKGSKFGKWSGEALGKAKGSITSEGMSVGLFRIRALEPEFEGIAYEEYLDNADDFEPLMSWEHAKGLWESLNG